ncbi:hypothetical protein T492DRAFT_862785 [Pavlovales sp. CCMP2436]|nr:hypothetical protein T492DRAFT_862785 [Pavlovales sp. CCMP2436]
MVAAHIEKQMTGKAQIRAEMPTSDDEWEVEKVLQYRTYYRPEQWLIKWKEYGEDRNTWEPLAHLSDDVQVDAQRVKELCTGRQLA